MLQFMPGEVKATTEFPTQGLSPDLGAHWRL